MKLRVCYSTRLIRQPYTGWVLYPFMFLRQAKEDVSDRLFRHEMEHVYQVRRDGWFTFYAKYLWHLYKFGYMAHPYELEARDKENDPLTPDERKLKDA